MAKHCNTVIPEFGTRLRKVLKDNHMTQRELARKINVDKKAVNCYVNDLYYPTSGVLKLICEVLDVSADYLLELD